MEYAAGAARFLTGTPNPAAHYAGTAGYDLIEEIGVDRIRENSLRQTQLLIDLADAAGFEVRSPREPARRGGAVIVDVPEAAAVYAELEARGILGDFRPARGSASARTSSRRTTRSGSRSSRSRRSSRRAPTSATSGRRCTESRKVSDTVQTPR